MSDKMDSKNDTSVSLDDVRIAEPKPKRKRRKSAAEGLPCPEPEIAFEKTYFSLVPTDAQNFTCPPRWRLSYDGINTINISLSNEAHPDWASILRMEVSDYITWQRWVADIGIILLAMGELKKVTGKLYWLNPRDHQRTFKNNEREMVMGLKGDRTVEFWEASNFSSLSQLLCAHQFDTKVELLQFFTFLSEFVLPLLAHNAAKSMNMYRHYYRLVLVHGLKVDRL